MPYKVCVAVGCCTTVSIGKYCEACNAARWKRRDRKRLKGNARARGYTSKWDKYSRAFRLKHPVCANIEMGRCVSVLNGKPHESGIAAVDHIEPHRGDINKFWDKTIHQALCRACHDRKTARGE